MLRPCVRKWQSVLLLICHPSCMDDSNFVFVRRRAWRNQRGNWNPYIEEEQTTQRPKEKVQKEKQRSTKHTHKTKHRITRDPLKTGGELRCSGRVNSSCSTSDTRRLILSTHRQWVNWKNYICLEDVWLLILYLEVAIAT